MKFATFNLFQMTQSRSDADVTRSEVEQMVASEDLGFDAAWIGEHHFGGEGVAGAVSVLLTAVAARTKRLRVGPAISILSINEPVRNAEDYATLDVLSEGRLDFGIGSGNRAGETLVWDIPFEETRERFAEALEIILGAWTQDEFSFTGKHYRVRHLTLYPKPVQKPHPPLFQAASSPDTERRCAERGIIPMPATFNPFSALKERRANFARVAREVGRTEEEIQQMLASIPYQRFCHVAETDEQARREAEGPMMAMTRIRQEGDRWASGRFGFPMPEGSLYSSRFGWRLDDWQWYLDNNAAIVGCPDCVAEKFQQFREEVGGEYLMLWLNPGGMDHATVMKSMQLLSDRVIPRFT